MSSIKKDCPTWSCNHCFGEASPDIMQHIFHYGCCPEWECGDTYHNSSVNVTCILRQYLLLGQLEGGLLAGDQDSEWEENYPRLLTPMDPFALWDGMSIWPSIWRLAPDVLFPRSLNLAAIDMKLVAVNWNSGFSHSNWAQRPRQEMKNKPLGLG